MNDQEAIAVLRALIDNEVVHPKDAVALEYAVTRLSNAGPALTDPKDIADALARLSTPADGGDASKVDAMLATYANLNFDIGQGVPGLRGKADKLHAKLLAAISESQGEKG